MLKFFKVIVINFFLGLVLFSLIEFTFGYWFDEDNLGPYMREYRMRKNNYNITYEGKQYEFVYKRNYYGFRGDEVPLEKISAVFIGGSTADERYKPDPFTITGLINNKINKETKDIELFNAGIEGQTTRGHMANLKFWFPRLKNFKPKYLIYYIGINEQYLKHGKADQHDGVVLDSNIRQRIWDNIKTRSIFYDLARKTKHKYYNSDKKILYDFDLGIKEYSKKENRVSFLSYKEFIKKNSIEEILKSQNKFFKNYLKRVDTLYSETIKMGAIPIFINQLDSTGFQNKKLITLNIFLIDHCNKRKYNCIDLARDLEGKNDYWWDGVHTTPKGSEAIANLIAPKLIEIFKKN